MKNNGILNEKEANQIYEILVEHCGASESYRDNFVLCHTDNEQIKIHGSSEFRFIGKLGFGGKFRINGGRFFVDYNAEDETLEVKSMAKTANELIAQLVSSFRVNVVGIHTSQCCKLHGCKYGNEDCPVSAGDVAQKYPCENCGNAHERIQSIQHNIKELLNLLRLDCMKDKASEKILAALQESDNQLVKAEMELAQKS